MPAQLIEITAEFMGERFRFENADGDVIVGEAHANGTINAPITIKGPADPDELRRSHSYRFYGKWSKYTNRRTGDVEEQFHFQTFVAVQPHNRDGVIAYLRHAGQGFGFGAARAAALWDAFGSDAVRVFREEPERTMHELAARKLLISAENYHKMARELWHQQALENCTIELTDLIAGRGLPKTIARRAIQEFGNLAAAVIRRDPYKLMRFRGCGFKRCDQMYLNLGLPAGRLKRQALSAWYALASNTNGDTWYPLRAAENGVRQNIAGAELRIDRAIELATRGQAIDQARTAGLAGPLTDAGSYVWVAEASKARQETILAEKIAEMLSDD